MFGSLGMGELIIIAGIALVVIGPEKFPEFTKIVMRTIRDLRGYVDEIKRDVGKELTPVKKELVNLSRYRPEDYIEKLTDSMMEDDDVKPPPQPHPPKPAAATTEGEDLTDDDYGARPSPRPDEPAPTEGAAPADKAEPPATDPGHGADEDDKYPD